MSLTSFGLHNYAKFAAYGRNFVMCVKSMLYTIKFFHMDFLAGWHEPAQQYIIVSFNKISS
jgi:hypothetical protein